MSQYLCRDTDELVLLQINLCNYADGEISPKGMENLDALFTELEQTDKHYIIRFLYDWEGKGREKEPKHMDIILKHMEQLEPVFHKYQESIFIHQGIFVGDCGEMHGSKFLSDTDMKTLLSQLVKVTPTSVYLSVRTPQHWRIVTETSEPLELNNHEFAFRLGLFNDGMMGTLQDTGTYGVINKSEAGDYGKWTRTEELLFQEMLCQEVPNGGEVIIDNPIKKGLVRFKLFDNGIMDCKQYKIDYKQRLKHEDHSIYEICFYVDNPMVEYRKIYDRMKYISYEKFKIKNCELCENYVDAFCKDRKICMKFDKDIPKEETTRAIYCSHFQIDDEYMNNRIREGIEEYRFDVLFCKQQLKEQPKLNFD